MPNTLFVAYLGKDDVRPFFFGTPTRFFPSTQRESPNWAKKWPEIVTICRATEPSPITPEDVKGGLIESNELPRLAGIVAWHASDGTGKVSFPALDIYNLSRTKKGITFRTHELACAPPLPPGAALKSLPVQVAFELADVQLHDKLVKDLACIRGM